ncbi:uncharacterized protein METZ01_LOCUS445113 [marine metagenome]|uniref:Uncharacterized protein n=1 Tax=marine metagenome TaxID=408172 RepID=A0A382ZAM8_9ZZZZ
MKKSLIVFLLLLLPWTAFAGISTKDKDTLKDARLTFHEHIFPMSGPTHG